MRICTFLTGEAGALRFAHKSYYEFFVAQALVLQWKQRFDSVLEFSKRHLSKETIYFLASYALEQEDVAKLLYTAIQSRFGSEQSGPELFHRILLGAGPIAKGVEIRGGRIKSVDIARKTLTSLSLIEVELADVFFRSCVLDKVKIQCNSASDVSLKEVDLKNSTLEFASSDNLAISQADVTGCHLTLKGEWEIENAKLTKSEIRFDGNGWLKKTRMQNCDIELGQHYRCGLAAGIEFNGCSIISATEENWCTKESEILFPTVSSLDYRLFRPCWKPY